MRTITTLLFLSVPGGAFAQTANPAAPAPQAPAASPAAEVPEESQIPTSPEEQRKQLSELLLKIGLCNEEFYGKEYCANLRNRAETAPDATPPLAAPPSTPAIQTPENSAGSAEP